MNEKNLIETLKQEKTESDMAILRNLIAVSERKVQDEAQNRVRSLDEIRNYFESKFVVIQGRLTHEET